jgi:hypothetical protein
MKYILKYFFSLLFLSIYSISFAQESIDPKTLKFSKKYGLRIGTDLNRLAKNFYEEHYKGFEITGDFRVKNNLYIATELGLEDKLNKTDLFNFKTSGEFIKLGVDYNVYKNWLDMNNMIYVGGRLAYANFSQNLEGYSINNSNTNFPSITYPGKEYNGLNAVWIEFVAGVKAEVLTNLFLGFSARLNYKINDTKLDNFENLYIPGFNKKYSGNFGVGFNYTISYLIPLYKK